jgi:GNAT superfamily N-acetyltransferase
MLWQVRALLDDRPGAMAAIAADCGERAVNILALQIFPTTDGRVIDEVIVHTPGGWAAADVASLFRGAGVTTPRVRACSPHALEDQPVRHLRAAQVLVEAPELLEDQLCQLLDARRGSGGADDDRLVLDEGEGPTLVLHREHAFTETERARAGELRRLATRSSEVLAGGPEAAAAPEPDGPESAAIRPGTVHDVAALQAMHHRCSAETVYRRFHTPVPRLSPGRARALLVPEDGVSLVVEVGTALVGAGVLAPGPDGFELAVVVEDRWQRRGLGARLVRALAEQAARLGLDTVTCAVQPANPGAPRTLRSAGLRARVAVEDGVAEYRIPLTRLSPSPRRRANRPAMGEVTTPLVALLRERSELREVYPPADFIDQAVRGGA